MLNSLDSIEHVVACLQQKNKDANIQITPYHTNNLEDMEIVSNTGYTALENYSPDKLFFGVLTLSGVSYWYSATGTLVTEGIGLLIKNDTDTVGVGDNPNVFRVDPNSQCVELFHGLVVENYPSSEIDEDINLNVAGQFRGFQIDILR